LYFCQKEEHEFFKLAEKLDGQSFQEFSTIAKKYKSVIIVPIFEKRANGLYHNSLIVINDKGDLQGYYRKMHIPDDPLYYEKFYFTPGDTGFKSFNTKFGNVGTLICWDQWYPEAARITSLKGAEILFYPTAIGWHPSEKEKYGQSQRDSWITIQRSHAIANGVFVAAVNRIGFEKVDEKSDGIIFWGSSFICDPQGRILVQASEDKEEILFADLDFSKVDVFRTHWPFFRDRRIDAYDEITKRFID
ncbi:MAG: carbon-nitrogen hydrolase, partial [Ignavibacteria bacterium]|nr:carbon-nitrogen hydrolase [Ignavibacteria bacterium]